MRSRFKSERIPYLPILSGSLIGFLLIALFPFLIYLPGHPYFLAIAGLLVLIFSYFWLSHLKSHPSPMGGRVLWLLIIVATVAASFNEVLLNLLGCSNLLWFALICVYGILVLGSTYLWRSGAFLALIVIATKWSMRDFDLPYFESREIKTIYYANYLSSLFGLGCAAHFILARGEFFKWDFSLNETIKYDDKRTEIVSVMNQNVVRKFLEPLKVITQANSELMKLNPSETAGLEKISVTITNSSARILNITKALLKISGEEKTTQFEYITLCELIEDAANSFGQSRNIDYIQVKVRGVSGCLVAFGNRHELREVIFAMLQNSFESTQKVLDKKINIEINKQGKNAVISIMDSGLGVSSESKNYIFNPFFSTKDIGGGAGLGLSVARSVVESLGGDVKLVSPKPGECTFHVLLPLADKDKL